MTTGALVAWLERQPADGGYNYLCNGTCMLARYVGEVTGKPVHMGGSLYYLRNNESDSWSGPIRLPDGWNGVARSHPHTFGAAAERARALR